ncbi:hypothetical protein [Roseococcus sp. YIM B11640]|uniref:hypothetical protein n=1 Tax=Roseococcus sp. YIM B11640 TaxID=3133973 RepID=UPI003C7D35E3
MTETFIRTALGALNLRFVRRFRQEARPDGSTTHYAVPDDGPEVPVFLSEHALERLCQRFVPATPGDVACFLSVDEDKESPAIADVWEQHVKIIAWGIDTNYGPAFGIEPIFADTPCSNQHVFLAKPDGTWFAQERGDYKTLDEAKREVLAHYIKERGQAGASDQN